MGNMVDYLREYGDRSFLKMPLNEVDSLILCQLSYLNYGWFVPGLDKGNAPVSIRTIYEDSDRDRILDDYWYRADNKELFALAAESARFGTLKLNFYVNIVNEEEQAQFSAITYVLEDKNVFIAYRGTDATIVGWKEDLNLAFSKPLHSQYLAVEYMERVAGCVGGKFYVGGHSKGGNLAAYAAMNCADGTRDRILKIFNNDGPGFRPEIREQGNYAAVADRMVKFIPRSSIVGVILQEDGDYEIVDSKSVGMLQHNTYTWKVAGSGFVRVKNMTGRKIVRDASLNEWILSLSEDEIHLFVDTLYEVISASEASNVFEFGEDWKNCLQNVLQAAKEVSVDTKKTIQRMIHSLFNIMFENMKSGI